MLSEEIKNLGLEGDIDETTATLAQYSTDASLFYVTPELVVFPKTVEDIKKLVLFVAGEKKKGRTISLTARSAGTDMTGGPLTESIVLSFTKYFNHLIELGDDYAIVEPGMYYRDFEKETLKKDLLLPSYPASRELCAMGGIVNNNSGGEKTLKYGKTEQYIESISMVMEDGNEYTFSKLAEAELKQKMGLKTFEGEIYTKMFNLITENYDTIMAAKPDVHKNSAGYYLWNVYDKTAKTFNLAKMICGAQGTFGMMTKAKIRLIHPQKYSKLLVIFLKDFSLLTDVNSIVLPLNPESFEAYDDNTVKFAVKFFPEILHQLKVGIFKVILNTMPEMLMVAMSGIPKLILLAEFTADTPEEAETMAQQAHDALQKKLGNKIKMRVTKSDDEAEEFWVVRRESFNLLRKHVRGMRTAPFIDDFSVRADKLPEFLPKLYEIMGKYKLLYTIAGHIGDGNFHIIPLMDLTNPKSKEVIITLSKEVYDLIISFHGTITSEHNDGIIRTPFLLQMYGEKVCGLFAEAKHIFDPLNMFNPGKKVGGTFQYAEDHINTKKV
jgi:FAD/FMN-containing dehydrogenase